MPQFILMLRDNETGGAAPSEAELHAIMKKFGIWKNDLQKEGKLRGGEKLKDGEGRVLRKESGLVATNSGPYRAQNEVLGGFFVIEARSYDEAAELATSCPQLDFGPIEVREVEEM